MIDANRALLDYLAGRIPRKELIKKVSEVASEECQRRLEKDLGKLKQGSSTTWARLIFLFWDEPGMLKELYYLSPWKGGATLVRLDYGWVFLKKFDVFPNEKKVSIDRAEKIVKSYDWILNDCDKYLITMSDNGITKAYWIGNSTKFECNDGVHRALKKPRNVKEWTGRETLEQREKFC